MSDSYKILKLNNNASLDEIKKSWRILALQYHPDRNKDPGSIDKFREITEAYEILYNERKEIIELDSIRLSTRQSKVKIGNPNEFSFVEVKLANNSFFGTLRISENSNYFVIFVEGYLNLNNWVKGEIWLVEMDNLLWIQKIERPTNAAVSNNGTVALLHKRFSDSPVRDKESIDLGGSLLVVEKSGETLFSYEFGSNIEGCAISRDGTLVSVATLFPDNSIYFFDVQRKILLWKYKSHIRIEPILDLKFRGNELDVFTGHTLSTKKQAYTLMTNGTLTNYYENKLNDLQKLKEQRPSEKVDSLLSMITSSDARDVTDGFFLLASFVKTKGSAPYYTKIVDGLAFLLDGKDDLFDPIWKVVRQILKINPEVINPIVQRIISKLKTSRYDDIWVLTVLGELGKSNPLWVKDENQFIKKKLKSKFWNERRFAAFAIGAIGSNDPSLVSDVIPLLIKYGAHPENICKEINEISDIKKTLFQEHRDEFYVSRTIDDASWIRDACIDAIGMIGKKYPEAVKDAIPMLKDLSTNSPSPYTKKKALRALEAFKEN